MATYIVTNNQDLGIGSFRWAIAQANTNSGADTIEFEVDVVTLNSAILITDTAILNGNDVTINQTGTERLLNITDNNSETLINVTLNNLTLTGGRPEELGGAIYTFESLTVNDSVIRDNITSQKGGGIYSEGGTLTITNSLFEQNKIVGESASSSGGAFYIQDGTLNIDNSRFDDNESYVGVGAIAGGQSSITNSSFNNNNGNALSITNNNVTTIDLAAFTNNFSQLSGAGIRVESGAEVIISDSLIDNNQSNNGAGIFIADSIVEINKSNLTNNIASERGGAITVEGTGELTIMDSTISGNSAPVASALEVYGNGGTALVENVNITGNTGSDNQVEGNVTFAGGNTGGILELPLVESSLNLVEVDRFYQYEKGFHFYTADDNESQSIQAQSEVGELKYNYENVSYSALSNDLDALTGETIEGVKPVYRFFNEDTGAHLFTMDSNEKEYIEEALTNYSSEGIAYYAFESQSQNLNTVPVYRLLNGETGAHLFSADQNEVDYIQGNLDNYSIEGNNGVAFYALRAEI